MLSTNIDILRISELKWTGMSEFNSHDHYIYYCGQESLRRNGVDITVNKRIENKTQRNRVEREVGGWIGMGNTYKSMADSCQCMTEPLQYCKVLASN